MRMDLPWFDSPEPGGEVKGQETSERERDSIPPHPFIHPLKKSNSQVEQSIIEDCPLDLGPVMRELRSSSPSISFPGFRGGRGERPRINLQQGVPAHSIPLPFMPSPFHPLLSFMSRWTRPDTLDPHSPRETPSIS